MLPTGNFNDLLDNDMPANEESSEDETEEEEDNYIRGRTDIDPEICPHCNKYPLEGRKYPLKNTQKSVLYCENDGYLCIICRSFLPDPPQHPQQTVLICPKGHVL